MALLKCEACLIPEPRQGEDMMKCATEKCHLRIHEGCFDLFKPFKIYRCWGCFADYYAYRPHKDTDSLGKKKDTGFQFDAKKNKDKEGILYGQRGYQAYIIYLLKFDYKLPSNYNDEDDDFKEAFEWNPQWLAAQKMLKKGN